ncbi:hypothetical protein FisN_8Lh296 [Fistulifera solaris]|uniref:Uncharacterized protein n=1 Tax=Fistulifera solaris TaxID=1519565 RepID=A0A1Z5JNS2_FISSO|nr:hypothetical protein FisN_8Lh296 [Fistulifera solaris]|eukprot:GAX15408.1 hypothetical protein FisN_8Lh296 [Fistulifera solaris]
MRSLSDADRAKLQRRVPSFHPTPRKTSLLDPELKSIFERKLESAAFFKPVAEVTPEYVPKEESISPALPESAPPTLEETVETTEFEEMKQSSTLLTRTMLFAERRRKEGREVFRRRMQTSACNALNDTDVAVDMECASASPSVNDQLEMPEKERTPEKDADTVLSFPNPVDTSFSSVDLTDGEYPWTISRPNELLSQLKQLSTRVAHMISSEERKEEEKDSEENDPIYSARLKDAEKANLKWYERPFKTHPFDYIPKPSSRFNCLCPGMVDF